MSWGLTLFPGPEGRRRVGPEVDRFETLIGHWQRAWEGHLQQVVQTNAGALIRVGRGIAGTLNSWFPDLPQDLGLSHRLHDAPSSARR